ncbi:MAG: hypothetical protein JWM33_968 [Caulobacteraceae bacterium]|nr:hypothetical protein [Caulobacteraceae bacterium]
MNGVGNMRSLIVFALAFAAVPLVSQAQIKGIPKEDPQPTVGGCVWAAKPALLHDYLLAADNNKSNNTKLAAAKTAFFTKNQPELLAQAVICEKRSDIPANVSMIAITGELNMREAQPEIADKITRAELNKIWTSATDATRACVRAPVYKALGVTPPPCAAADPTAPLVKEVQLITNGDLNATRLKDEQFAAKANAIDYYYASMARAELAETQIARAPPPAAGQ